MRDKFFPILTLLLLLFSVFLYVNVDKTNKRISELKNLTIEIKSARDHAIASIDSLNRELRNEINEDFRKNFNNIAETIIDKKLKSFKSQLFNIQKKIDSEKTALENIKSKKRRELLGLPEQVDLDDLYKRYKNSNSVSFDTEKGSLYFSSYNIEIAIVPSLQKPAWIRIGKENSDDNSALIKTWLKEAANEKIHQGYRLVSNRTRPSDYGEYTEKLYKKGDMYFKTYFQYIRYQGTYNSTYLRYTYYVEIGSQKRKRLYFAEQYNLKLGS